MRPCRWRGFTLIELLIVVAIIAILAAIAVPNFLEAQTRAKISRSKADMRSMATALETYHIDNNGYVYQNKLSRAIAVPPVNTPTLEKLTTPIAYLTGVTSFRSPFTASKYANGNAFNSLHNFTTPEEKQAAQIYWYNARNNGNPSDGAAIWGRGDPKALWYFTHTAGPTGIAYATNGGLNAMTTSNATNKMNSLSIIYDATNGTTSAGGIFRVGGTATTMAKDFYDALQGAN
jgi:type II secretion system protein G